MAEKLKRTLTLPLVVFYGLGITIGAGIYVLIGEIAARSGALAPLAFIAAAIVVLFPALCFAELSARFPFASGAAQYVEESFGLRWLGRITGLLMILAGLVAASTISLGAVRYLVTIIEIPWWVLLPSIVTAVGYICARGVRESVVVASLLTIVEIGGLVAVVLGGLVANPEMVLEVRSLVPSEFSASTFESVLRAAPLAFFAFIGFEGISNVAEETKSPQRNLPTAIILTLIISTVIYIAVTSVAILTVGAEELAIRQAPLSHLFEKTTGLPSWTIALVAVVATLNGVIVQIIMISRLAYGMSSRGLLHPWFGVVHGVWKTPVNAIVVTTSVVILFALLLPVTVLAEWTSRIILLVFALVCLSLFRLKLSRLAVAAPGFTVHWMIPLVGSILCGLLLVADFVWGG